MAGFPNGYFFVFFLLLEIKTFKNTSKSAPSDFNFGHLFQSIPMYNRDASYVRNSASSTSGG
jgi:hypothetical protein